MQTCKSGSSQEPRRLSHVPQSWQRWTGIVPQLPGHTQCQAGRKARSTSSWLAGHLRQQTPDVAEHLLLRAAARRILGPPLGTLLGPRFEPLLHELFNASGMQQAAHGQSPPALLPPLRLPMF